MKDTDTFEPKIEQPTEEEIAAAIKDVQEKNGVMLSNEVAAHYLKLRAELGWWIGAEEDLLTDEPLSEETAKWIQTMVSHNLGRVISIEDARTRAKEYLDEAASREKERLGSEIRALTSV